MSAPCSWPRMNYLGIRYDDRSMPLGGELPPRIVVGVDGSEQSVHALRWAAQHALRLGLELHAVIGWQVPVSILVAPTYTEGDYACDAEQRLDAALIEAFGRETPLPVTKHVVAKDPGQALIDAALDADMLVVGSYGRGLTKHLHGNVPGVHLGSVAKHCVHNASCAVVIIGWGAAADENARLARKDQHDPAATGR